MITLFAACSKKDNAPATLQIPTLYKDTGNLFFISQPISASEVQFTFPKYPSAFATITLRSDTGTVGVFPVTLQQLTGYSTAIVTYPFQSGTQYTLTVETVPANGLAYRYVLPKYIHTYLAPFTSQKLLSFTQLQGYDISPSRKTIFALDNAQKSPFAEKLSLADGTVTPVTGNIHGYTPIIRAIDDTDILAAVGLAGTPAGSDSGLLYRMNTNTGKTANVAVVSADYARYSRIIDNHILTTLPVYPGDAELIDLTDNSVRIIPYSTINFTIVRETNFDHIFYGDQIVDPNTGTLQTIMPPGTDSSDVVMLDSATQYLFLAGLKDLTTAEPNVASYFTNFSVYSGNNLIFEDNFVRDRAIIIPKQPAIINNRLLLNQNFGWDTTFHVSGYYQLDLNTRSLTLVNSTSATGDDFQLSPHTMISVRSDGVYRITVP